MARKLDRSPLGSKQTKIPTDRQIRLIYRSANLYGSGGGSKRIKVQIRHNFSDMSYYKNVDQYETDHEFQRLNFTVM